MGCWEFMFRVIGNRRLLSCEAPGAGLGELDGFVDIQCSIQDVRGIQNEETWNGGFDFGKRLGIVNGWNRDKMLDAGDLKAQKMIATKPRIHALKSAHELFPYLVVRLVEIDRIRRDVFGKVHQGPTAKEIAIDNRGHFDDRGIRDSTVRDIRYVKIGKRMFEKERRANNSLILDVPEAFFLSRRQLGANAGCDWRSGGHHDLVE